MNAQPLPDLLPEFASQVVATCGASSTQNPSKVNTSNHKGLRAAYWGCGGREFEPRRSDHFRFGVTEPKRKAPNSALVSFRDSFRLNVTNVGI